MSGSSTSPESKIPVQKLADVTILFAGDSGDGMQLTGNQFTLASAFASNDLATLPDFPAEIRAPAGTTYGVSAFQLHFGSVNIHTPGDEVDLLVAMNAAALKVNLNRVRKGGSIIVNVNSFEQRDLELAKYEENPLENDSLAGYKVYRVELTTLTREALKDSGLNFSEVDRSKNMFALGLSLWLFSRPTEPVFDWIKQKFGKKPDVLEANLHVFKKGLHYGETTEDFEYRYDVLPAEMPKGKYRTIHGNRALALGFAAASEKLKVGIFYGSYPITPASDLLHELSRMKRFNVRTFQAEDEIAAVGAAIGACFGGAVGVCGTSGPGLALKAEAVGLAVMTELPLVVVNVQRAGPSTGLPTKTEQSDLLQALYGRNGEAPLCVIAPASPGDCFHMAFEACRLATKYMTPVILLSDGYLGNGSEPWLIPDSSKLAETPVQYATTTNREVDGEKVFLPYVRDETTLSRPWAIPGTKRLEHRLGGLEKAHETGNVDYDPDNHEFMTKLREEKVQRMTADIPPTEIRGSQDGGDCLLIGWGSTKGAIDQAVERMRADGKDVSSIHIRYISPLPADLGEILSKFKTWIVPELNNGQLVKVLRAKYLLPLIGLNKIQGQPFTSAEIEHRVMQELS